MELSGYVSSIRYRREETGYTVFELVSDNIGYTVIAKVADIDEGANVHVAGEMVMHPVYGEQINASVCEVSVPDDTDGLLMYLGSGAIRGVGETMASRIIEKFGSDAAHILENEPERLAEIKGISERKARDIALQFREKAQTRKAFVFLRGYGISNNMSVRIYDEYGEDIYGILRENPYKLAEDIRGIGFKTADEIAERSGIRVDSQYRIRAGLMYVLSQAIAEGHMFLPAAELTGKAAELLDIDRALIETEITNLAVERKVVVKGEDVYAAEYYYAELKCAVLLHDIDSYTEQIVSDTKKAALAARIERLETETGMHFDPLQRQAIEAATSGGILILSGGPGTGKTTTINALIKYFTDEGMDIMLAAPTGRAAKRMTEATGYEAKTIHRLLELSGAPDDDHSRARFERNEDNPLETDVIILDEMSMVDIFLFLSLLKAVTPGTRLIMVGDVDQLPSVGPGQVLKDMIDSGAFRVVMLEQIFRQEEGSDIITNAHSIRAGRYPVLGTDSKDFFFLERSDVKVMYKHMVELITQMLPGYVSAQPMDIQVLTPMRKGPLGVESLNRILQQYINPPSDDKKEIEYGETIFREGDKVMQVRNNYQLEWYVTGEYNIRVQSGTGVFNGDVGCIRSIDEEQRMMTIEFEEGHLVDYEYSLFEDLETAYAVTIHKSQGSEYPAVIIPVISGPPQLLNRNLLYTAVTRARHSVVLMGNRQTFYNMVDNDRINMRHTGFADRIREVCL
ncbi:exodeoxyribonuclease V alpha subunit [Lachnospiraceae bacterium XBB2008]|nr:exodeoxyribonuclease V alpha subunit [Lachnospiraceae bacterium XBB2008]